MYLGQKEFKLIIRISFGAGHPWLTPIILATHSGGRDQEDCGLKPAQANSSPDPCLQKTHHKKGLVEWLKV
jgi:hypothetical protein